MEERYSESPEIVSWVDAEQSKLTVQFGFVNVEKENINLMMNENGCYLIAPADDVEYVATFSFFHAVKPADAKAEFRDGYLTVEVPFKDSPDCVRISLESGEAEEQS
jgi:HSP20 family molecular chaperone IbpA